MGSLFAKFLPIFVEPKEKIGFGTLVRVLRDEIRINSHLWDSRYTATEKSPAGAEFHASVSMAFLVLEHDALATDFSRHLDVRRRQVWITTFPEILAFR
jgi:hypothetical protein